MLPFFGPIKPEDYLALVTLHGTLMLFFVLTLAPQAGFGNLILPAQIGARRMAFPALNAAGFWLIALGAGCAARLELRAGRRGRSPAGRRILRSPPSPPQAPARGSAWTCGCCRSALFGDRAIAVRSTCLRPSSPAAAPA